MDGLVPRSKAGDRNHHLQRLALTWLQQSALGKRLQLLHRLLYLLVLRRRHVELNGLLAGYATSITNCHLNLETVISCLNIQEGAFIPVGTEIIPVSTSSNIFEDRINFRDTEGREYSIRFDVGHRMVPMRDFVAYTFTTSDRRTLLKDVPEVVVPRVLRGEVVPGMNQAQVLLAYGPPPAIRTPDLRNESWIYWIGHEKTIRLVFRGDKVVNIININQN